MKTILNYSNCHIAEEKGLYYLINKDSIKELDAGFVISLLEKISKMNNDETLEYITENKIKLKKWKF